MWTVNWNDCFRSPGAGRGRGRIRRRRRWRRKNQEKEEEEKEEEEDVVSGENGIEMVRNLHPHSIEGFSCVNTLIKTSVQWQQLLDTTRECFDAQPYILVIAGMKQENLRSGLPAYLRPELIEC